jgi:uncharacterized membrane protein
VLLMSTLGVRPAAAMLHLAQQVLLRQGLIHRVAKPIPLFILLPIVASGVVLVSQRGSGAWPIVVRGWVFSFYTAAITVFVNVPLNRRFTRWSPSALPLDWQTHVRSWDRANAIRLILALAAFACAVISGSERCA